MRINLLEGKFPINNFYRFCELLFFFQDLEELHVKYKSKLEETLSLQKKCQSAINHQRYR